MYVCTEIVAPVCRPGQKTLYSGGRQETIKVLCELEANPHNVTFNWKFNASATEFLDLPASQIFPERNNAVAQYTPMTEHVSRVIKPKMHANDQILSPSVTNTISSTHTLTQAHHFFFALVRGKICSFACRRQRHRCTNHRTKLNGQKELLYRCKSHLDEALKRKIKLSLDISKFGPRALAKCTLVQCT